MKTTHAAILSILVSLSAIAEAQNAPFAPMASYNSQLQSACTTQAKGTPAEPYCYSFVTYLTATNEGVAQSEFRHLSALAGNQAQLATAYGIYVTTEDALQSQAIQNLLNDPRQKQVGAPVSASGIGTDLVSKPTATSLIALAVQSGALTQTQNGNTITLQTNLDHLFHAIFLDGATSGTYLPSGTPILENFTASASLAENSTSTTTVPISGSATGSALGTSTAAYSLTASKLSSATVNYQFTNKLTQRYLKKYLQSPSYKSLNLTIDTSQLTQTSGKLAADFVGHVPSSCGDELYQSLAAAVHSKWSALAAAKQSDPPAALFADFTNRFNSCFAQTMTAAAKASPGALQQDFAAFQDALAQNISAYRTQLAQKLPGWNISAQYVFSRPVAQPETHDLRLIASGDLPGSSGPSAKSVWTLNAATSFYGPLPAGAQYGHFKDAQISGELDKALGSSSSSPTFSLAGYGQYQQKPSILVLNASSVPSGVTLPADAQGFIQGTQGWLGVVQVKFTFHLGGSQIPLAGKWSNHTNLLDKSKFGGQFGVSYDISSLKQLLGFAAPAQ